MHTSLYSFPRCLPRAQRCKKKGELVESQCSNAADLKVMKMFESLSSHGLLCALTEKGEAHLFSQVPVSDKRNQPTAGQQPYRSAPDGALQAVCSERRCACTQKTSPEQAVICFSPLTLSACTLVKKLASSVHARHVLLYLLHQTVLQGVHTSNMHTDHGGTQNWAKSYTHISTDAERHSEQPHCIYLLENSHLKVYSNPPHTMSPSTYVRAQTLSPGFLCHAVSGVAECAWSVSQIYHIPGLYPDPFNEVSNVSVHVSISSGMSDK